VQLPISIRDALVDELDEMLDAYSTDPDTEAVVTYLLEQLEILADEAGIEDVLTEMEEDASLEAPLPEVLESEMSSNDEFEFTGEEIVSLLERICAIEWDEEGADSDEWDDEEEDEEEDEDEDEAAEDEEA
jgi:hypothetical protein